MIAGPRGLFGKSTATTAAAITTTTPAPVTTSSAPSVIIETYTGPLDKILDASTLDWLTGGQGAGSKIIVTGSTKKPTPKAKSVESKKKESEHEELMRLKKEHGSSKVHDVIVIGEHVEGDDKYFDYEDHSEHHDKHDDKKLRLKHKSNKKAKSSSSATAERQVVVKTTETTKEKKVKENDDGEGGADEEDEHKDHLHLLKGLSAGDVIHIDAGESETGGEH